MHHLLIANAMRTKVDGDGPHSSRVARLILTLDVDASIRCWVNNHLLLLQLLLLQPHRVHLTWHLLLVLLLIHHMCVLLVHIHLLLLLGHWLLHLLSLIELLIVVGLLLLLRLLTCKATLHRRHHRHSLILRHSVEVALIATAPIV